MEIPICHFNTFIKLSNKLFLLFFLSSAIHGTHIIIRLALKQNFSTRHIAII